MRSMRHADNIDMKIIVELCIHLYKVRKSIRDQKLFIKEKKKRERERKKETNDVLL